MGCSQVQPAVCAQVGKLTFRKWSLDVIPSTHILSDDADRHVSYFICTNNLYVPSEWTSTCQGQACVSAAEANVHRLTQNEQRELQNRMEKKQMKEFMNVSRRSIALSSELIIQAKCMGS